jgi:hypothetical protein
LSCRIPEPEPDIRYLPLLIGVACAVAFYRAAEYEHMSPWAWTVSSIGLTALIGTGTSGIAPVLLGQVALFAVMWWYNARRSRRGR